ncbi:amine oxidase [flavin-containing] B isoform X2 [Microplitis demolitor]|nr:amine oxidase [flavin-containing] B isoform X2 [Microplitis demolitor]XP_053595864.1 amine oxidase [flavin-containing] B isoform X2 [Microplitis demolitor]
MIIESKDEIGGRCNNINNGFYGHTFQNNFMNLLNNLNLPIIYGRKSEYKKLTLHVKNNKLVNGGDDESSIISSQVRYFIKSLELSCKKKNFKEYTKDEYSKYLASLSVNDYINGTIFSSRARLICRSYISLICGISNLNNVSCLWLFVMLNYSGGFYKRLNYLFDNNTRFFIEGGIGQVINRLRNEILEKNGSINYSESVKKINQDDIGIKITTSLKTYKCNYVIIAVPPPESSSIVIESTNNDKNLLNFIKTQPFYFSEPSIYFELTYKSPFWINNYSGSVMTIFNKKVNLKLCYDASQEYKELNLLAGFINESENLFSGKINLFKALNQSFATKEAGKFLNYTEINCNSTINVLKPCSVTNHHNPLLNPTQKIYFAASEYSKTNPGTADGAIGAGEHVACLLLHYARPQALEVYEIMKYIPQKGYQPKKKVYTQFKYIHSIILFTNLAILLTLIWKTYASKK